MAVLAPIAGANDNDLKVVAVPWKINQPHPTYNGRETVLKAVANNGFGQLSYEWDFGDGTPPETATVGDRFQLAANHTYPDSAPGTVFNAHITVTDANGAVSSDNYDVIVKEETQDVEVDIAIDEGLWYLHKTQDRFEYGGIIFGRWPHPEGILSKNFAGPILEAFAVQGHTPGRNPDEDPYVDTVRRGLNNLLEDLSSIPIAAGPSGDPDSNGNGLGLAYGRDAWQIFQMFNQPAALLAISATKEPTVTADNVSPDVVGRTYSDLADDMVDYIGWAQNDPVPANGIHVYDLSTGIDTVVAEGGGKDRPDISGRYVVWQDYRNSNSDIYLYDLDTDTEIPIVTDPSYQAAPAISGDRIVWIDSRNGSSDIYLYDISLGVERRVTTSMSPKGMLSIDGDKIVWMDARNGDPDIYMYDLATETEVPITVRDGLQMEPDVSGDKVVWGDYTGSTAEIFMYDLSTGIETQITTNGSSKYTPIISGDQIVWTDFRNGNADIYGYDISTGTEMAINTDPANNETIDIDGARIVYTELEFTPWAIGFQVLDMSTGTEAEIMVGESEKWPSAISGDLVAWTSWAAANPNVSGAWWFTPNSDRANNWVSRWPILGLVSAEENLGISAPDWLKSELEVWLDYTQNEALGPDGLPGPDYGGFGMSSPNDRVNFGVTATGILGMNYVGAPATDQRIVDALGFLDRNWDRTVHDSGSYGNFGYYESMYGVARAMRTGNPPITMIGEHDWYSEYAGYLIDTQRSSGSWPYHSSLEIVHPTAMAILILSQTEANTPPTIAVDGTTISVDEGEEATNGGTVSDPDGDPTTLSASIGTIVDNGDGTWSWTYEAADGPAASQVTIAAEDGKGGSAETTFALNVANVSPQIESISVPIVPIEVNSEVSVSAVFTDSGVLDTHTAQWAWGDDDMTAGTVGEFGGSGSVSGTHVYTTPGVYTVEATVTDKDGGTGSSAAEQYIVVYDPDGGFVTGGGWITSPAGAYADDPDLTGKANFGFVSKYKNGASVPSGKTEFQFKAGSLNFRSTGYDWLVVGGTKAQFKGEGTVNGSGTYGFMLSAIDGKDASDPDTFRIKIWEKDTEDLIYDNKIGADETADPDTELGGGNIVVHKD